MIAGPTVTTTSRGRLFDWGYTPEQSASVAELLLASNATAQIGALPDGKGFLIRVWPPNGTHEFGGNSMTCFSMVLTFCSNGSPILKSLSVEVSR